MAIEITTEKYCTKCGKAYGKKIGNMPTSYAELYKGLGYIPICFTCIDEMYAKYLSQCNDPAMAVRQVCRKLDLYWNEKIFENAMKTSASRTVIVRYMKRLTGVAYAGKSYDDTLMEEGTMWNFSSNAQNLVKQKPNSLSNEQQDKQESDENEDDLSTISDDVISFWGLGYSADTYRKLEQRKNYYMNKFPYAFSKDGESEDIGSDILIRQLCIIEVNIANGTTSIDKSANTINTLIGSLNFKPSQKKNEDLDDSITNTPLGVWLFKYENEKPLPEVNEKLKDVNHIKKYVFTWLGHLCKMLDIKNGYTKMYQEEIDRLRVERPDLDDDDEEDLLINAYSETDVGGADG